MILTNPIGSKTYACPDLGERREHTPRRRSGGVLKISQGHAHAHAKKGPATFLSLSHTVSLCRYIRHPSRILQTLWREEGKSGIEHDMTAT